MSLDSTYRMFYLLPFAKAKPASNPITCSPKTSPQILLLLLCFFIVPVLSTAQPSGFAGSFTRLGFGPRGMAAGNTIIATVEEGVYGYYNPALAAYAKSGSQIDLSTSLMSFDRSLNSLSGTFRLPPSAGLQIALLNANVTDIDGRTADGYFTGELDTHEYQLMTYFGIKIHEKVAGGIGVKLNMADYHTDIPNATGSGFDIGVIYKASEKLSLGAAVRDLLASYNWNSGELYGDESLGESTENFPVQVNIGGSYKIQPEILIALHYGWLILNDERFRQLKVGGSWIVHERISLRGGWQVDDIENITVANRPSAGFSVHLPFDLLQPSVDYAFLREPNKISSMHVFGLRFQL